jgi:hypothetical protein
MNCLKLVPASLVLAALVATPAAVQAETFLHPFGGVAFGGSTDRSHGAFGGSLAFLSDAGLLGFEIEFSDVPHFFGTSRRFSSNNMLTLTGSLMIAPRVGSRGRIYASGGGGLLKARIQTTDEFFDVSRNDFCFDVGGGFWGYFSDHVGLRGDIRYFRDLHTKDANDDFDLAFGQLRFWRATGGLVLAF